jgi:hypothetical protein
MISSLINIKSIKKRRKDAVEIPQKKELRCLEMQGIP